MEVFQDHFTLLIHLSLSNIPLRKCSGRLRIRNWSPFRNQHPAGTTARSLTRSRGQAVPRPKFLSLWGGGVWLQVSALRWGDASSSSHTHPVVGTARSSSRPSSRTSHPITAHARSVCLRRQPRLPSAPHSAEGCYCCWGFFGFAFDFLD